MYMRLGFRGNRARFGHSPHRRGSRSIRRALPTEVRQTSRGVPWGAGKTLLLVSPDLTTIANVCSRAIWTERGKSVGDNHTTMILRAYLDSVSSADVSGRVDPDCLALRTG